jgi:hypothetical protein
LYNKKVIGKQADFGGGRTSKSAKNIQKTAKRCCTALRSGHTANPPPKQERLTKTKRVTKLLTELEIRKRSFRKQHLQIGRNELSESEVSKSGLKRQKRKLNCALRVMECAACLKEWQGQFS